MEYYIHHNKGHKSSEEDMSRRWHRGLFGDSKCGRLCPFPHAREGSVAPDRWPPPFSPKHETSVTRRRVGTVLGSWQAGRVVPVLS